jgi:hypothetical protein
MNISQMHERLRTVLLRKVQRGHLSVTLLSSQTGLGKSHISRYLHAQGQLSIHALDRILEAQHLGAEDLVDNGRRIRSRAQRVELVPLVSHPDALFEPDIRPGSVSMWLHLASEQLQSLRHHRVASRRSWRRFVAIRIERDEASPMDPVLYEGAIAVIDRHYNSLAAYHPPRQNMYAVRDGVRVMLRYIDKTGTHLIIRPRSIAHPANLIEIAAPANPGEYIAGRVAFIFNQV